MAFFCAQGIYGKTKGDAPNAREIKIADAVKHLQTCNVALPATVAAALVEKGFDADVVAAKTEQKKLVDDEQVEESQGAG